MKVQKFLTAIGLGVVLCASALAQGYPQKPITAIVPFVPGGSSDATMRVMSTALAKHLGQPVVLENKPGANGSIGAAFVARAPADGYTILIGSVGTYAITPSLLKNVGYDARKDFDLLTMAVRTPNVVVVPANFPVNSMAELTEYMKKNPGKVSFASSGIGSTDHLSALLLWQKTGTSGVHVAYRGGGAAISDLIAGHVQVLITNLGVLTGHINSGRMKALAVTSEKRVPELPQVPTVAEAGLKGLEVYSWQGIAAPRGLPPAVSEKLRTALDASLKDPQVRKQLETAGFEIVGSTHTEFAAQVASEVSRWKAVIDTAGITAE